MQQYSTLVELIYDAAIDPSRWPVFLATLSNAFEGASGLLHHYDAALKIAPTFYEFGHDPSFIRSYADHYASINPYPAESFGRLTTGRVDYAGTLLIPSAVTATEFYNDWMKPQGISPNHLGVVLNKSENVMALLCVAPHDAEFDQDPTAFAERLQLLVPHLTKAFELNRALGASQFAHATSNAMLDKLPAAVFLLHGTGRMLFANSRGEELLRAGRLVAVDTVTRKFRAFYAKECGRLEKALDKATSVRQPQILRLIGGETGTSYTVTVLPLAYRKSDLTRDFNSQGLAVLITTSSSQVDLRTEDIQAATGLTPAEARLVKALVSGSSLSEYAEASGLSINTVRRQLAATFSKTETRKQGELIALLIRTLGMIAQT